ncbi:MAG: endonuclease III [Firmicutes bacterium]|nr:endonuclease III [Bacillota bacterium]MBR6684563.1 endonuclease III [Bacillota bacterium]
MTKHVFEIINRLKAEYPDVRCELDYETPLQLLVATVLSAQTTDKQVNKVTAKMFVDCPDLEAFLKLTKEEIKGYIHTLGFYNAKADHLYLLFRQLASDFNGEVPQTMEQLTKLSGVGRKTANVVMSNAFGIPAIAVDTHVFRVSNRIGLAHADSVEKTEQQLMETIDQDWWTLCHHLLIFHGRRCCSARKPNCDTCVIREYCEAVTSNKDTLTSNVKEK